MIKHHIFQGSFKNILDKGSYSFFISLWVSAAFFFLRGVSNRCQQSQEPISKSNLIAKWCQNPFVVVMAEYENK